MKKITSSFRFVLPVLLVAGFLFTSTLTAFANTEPTTGAATAITSTDATLNGTNGDAAADTSGEGFWYGPTSTSPFTSCTNDCGNQVPAGWSTTLATNEDLAINGAFDFTVTGLTPSTTYYYVAWSEVGGTWSPGSVESFTTLPTSPVIDTHPSDPSNSLAFSFTFHDDQVGVTFECRVDADNYQACTSPFTGTKNAIQHEFDVKASDGTNDSTVTSFTWTITSTPNPTTLATSNINITAAQLNATNGTSDADDSSFWWGTTPVASFSTPADFPASDWSHDTGLGSVTAGATFSNTVTGLTANTTYYYAAWSEVGGTWYPGAVQTFTTDSLDTTSPTASFIFPTPGPSATSFKVVYDEPVIQSEATDPANYFLNNWPGAGGSGALTGNATVTYDAPSNTATVTFTNPGWYVSPEQQWGVQDVHDLANNLLGPNPTTAYSTPLVDPTAPGTPTTTTPTTSTTQDWTWTASTDPTDATNASGINRYEYSISGDTIVGWTSVGNTLGVTTNFGVGSYTLHVRAVDNAGNVGAESSGDVVVNLPADTTPPDVPIHISPADNTFTTTANQTLIDWTDVTDPSTPVTYIYQVSNSSATNGDGSFASPVYTSGPLSDSQIPTPGTPEGIYYWHVKACDAVANCSGWTDAWKITVDDTPPVVTVTPIAGSVLSGTVVFNITVTDTNLDPATLTNIFSYLYNSGGAQKAQGASVDLSSGTGTLTIDTTQLDDGNTWLDVGQLADAAGNLSGGSDTYFKDYIVDNNGPVITTPTVPSVEATSAAGAVVSYTEPSATDIVDITDIVTCDAHSGDTFPIGTTTVHCLSTDSNSNNSTATFDVTVTDTTAPNVPTLTGPNSGSIVKPAGLILDWSDSTDISNPITYYYESSLSTAVGANNALTSVIYGPVPLTDSQIDASGSADNTYYWQVKACDSVNNCSNWSGPWKITVDNTAPTLNLPANITTEATSSSGAIVTFTATATDANPANPDVTCLPVSGSTFALGTTPVNCSGTDTAGNIATGSFNVIVADTTAPVIAAHADVTAEATSSAGAIVTYTSPVTSDTVDGAGSATCSPISGSTFAISTTIVNCNAVDAHGNHAIQTSFNAVVSDTTIPVITLLGSATVNVTAGSTYSDAGATALDNINGDITANIVTVNPVNTSVVGIYIITYNVADASSNHAVQVTRTVNVVAKPFVGGGGGRLPLSGQVLGASTGPAGQVLGAEKFIFTLTLKLGSKGNEVTELQKFLNAAGYDCGAADGIFGAKTKSCVIKFQSANGLKGDGIVGLLTRAVLNK